MSPEAFPEPTLRSWKTWAERRAARDASTSVDGVADVIAAIDSTLTALWSFVGEWVDHERPVQRTDEEWHDYVDRIVKQGSKFQSEYGRLIGPKVDDVLANVAVVLGEQDPDVVSAREAATFARTNRLTVEEMASALYRLRAVLVLR